MLSEGRRRDFEEGGGELRDPWRDGGKEGGAVRAFSVHFPIVFTLLA